MTNLTLPAVGTKVRALYIPNITNTTNDDGATGTIVEVTQTCADLYHVTSSGEYKHGPVVYGEFPRPGGYQQTFYISEWETIEEPAAVPAPEQTEVDLLRQRLSNLETLQQREHREAVTAMSLISERLIEEANNRGWCSEYDHIVERINESLPGWLQLDEREGEYEVTWTETYTITIDRTATVTARDAETAADMVADDPDGFGDTYDIEQAFRNAWSYGNYTHESSDNFEASEV